MTDWQDVSDLTPYDHLAAMAVTCAGLLRDMAGMSGEITSDDEVQELLTALITKVAPAWMQAWDELMLLLEHEPGAAACSPQKGETCVPEVMRHEDDVTYSAAGHVEPALFLLAVAADLLANGEAEDARDALTERNGNWRFPAVANALKTVTHVYYRFDQLPEDDEHMALCAADADGALPFTVVDVA